MVTVFAASGGNALVFVRIKKIGAVSRNPKHKVLTSHLINSKQLWTVWEPVGSSSITIIFGFCSYQNQILLEIQTWK
ncbi:hypothetical protein RINTHM_5270 [Richelia intracellularis HM01]|nr:hypothetical protein RINTHM_5270 [Richelia intracellularis HM01]